MDAGAERIMDRTAPHACAVNVSGPVSCGIGVCKYTMLCSCCSPPSSVDVYVYVSCTGFCLNACLFQELVYCCHSCPEPALT